jgi:uncharacterized protein YbaA (DUF1428 family)
MTKGVEMPGYVDGFVLPVKRAELATYKKLARLACKVWKEHGATAYVEAVGDEMLAPGMVGFPKLIKTKPDEVVVFAWATFATKSARTKANAAIMNDPRLKKAWDAIAGKPPFDCKRMAWGGFRVMVQG